IGGNLVGPLSSEPFPEPLRMALDVFQTLTALSAVVTQRFIEHHTDTRRDALRSRGCRSRTQQSVALVLPAFRLRRSCVCSHRTASRCDTKSHSRLPHASTDVPYSPCFSFRFLAILSARQSIARASTVSTPRLPASHRLTAALDTPSARASPA